MDTSTTGPLAPTIDPAIATDDATFGAAHLEVTDLDRSLTFWEGLIGLRLLERSGTTARLGVGATELLVLHAVADGPARRGHTGLYHVALHLPNEPEFARILGRLIRSRHRIGPTDHTFSKAIYLSDPDGLGLELTLETPELMEVYELSDAAIRVVDVHGRERTPSDPLDIAAVMATLGDGDLAQPLPTGTRIGHLHLHVADLAATQRFYLGLGLKPEVYAPGLGAAHFSAGGPFKHRLATNTWQGAGATPAPAGSARMRHFELVYDGPARLDAALHHLGVEAIDGSALVRDPSGTAVRLSSRT
jgi:catechol 2,3-dioxygenase